MLLLTKKLENVSLRTFAKYLLISCYDKIRDKMRFYKSKMHITKN